MEENELKKIVDLLKSFNEFKNNEHLDLKANYINQIFDIAKKENITLKLFEIGMLFNELFSHSVKGVSSTPEELVKEIVLLEKKQIEEKLLNLLEIAGYERAGRGFMYRAAYRTQNREEDASLAEKSFIEAHKKAVQSNERGILENISRSEKVADYVKILEKIKFHAGYAPFNPNADAIARGMRMVLSDLIRGAGEKVIVKTSNGKVYQNEDLFPGSPEEYNVMRTVFAIDKLVLNILKNSYTDDSNNFTR